MNTAKLFTNGGSQAVRLPKDCRFSDEEIFIHKIGSVVMLFPKENKWQALLDSLNLFTDDFLAEPISSLPLEEREVIV
ncbi:MAG: AbrB/MazE/SpoVT family DNA-binding domain-containing protein [Lachnospiraceae bacterium]|nr:AbrB/MazE/SpoVT family DNA-binding domain-containing protein [Lachnospiraceae bacterium]